MVRVDRREGDVVRAGDTLVVLTQATLRPNVDAQQARVNTATARLRDLVAGARSTEIAQAESELRAAQAEADRTARDVERLAPLADKGEISKRDFDVAQAAARTAAARRDAVRDQLRTLQSGARPEEIDAARSEVAAAQAALRAATATQADLVLTSPVAGTIITRSAEPGEVMSPGAPAMTVADVARPYVRVYVNQSVLPTLHVGGSVTATLDAFPDKAVHGTDRRDRDQGRVHAARRADARRARRSGVRRARRIRRHHRNAQGRPAGHRPIRPRREMTPAAMPRRRSGQTTAVRMTALRKVFGPLVAVDDLTLEIRRGEVFGLLGPNGSGKTTTIRMLCGLLEPTSGTASVAGYDVEHDPEAVKRNIGYMSQKYGLYDDLTVVENIRFYATIYGLSGAVREARLVELMNELGLTPRMTQRAGTLSGGWKQRLALACATAHQPPVLFLDEPTAGVDPASRRRFWERIHELARGGTTILVTTHYMDEASQCTRLAFLSRGHLIAVGTPAEIPAMFGQSTIEDVFVSLQEKDEGRGAAEWRAAAKR